MKYSYRINKLERKFVENQELWAVFQIKYRKSAHETVLAQDRVLSKYLAQGNLCPTHRVFLNMPGPEIPAEEEKFLYAFSR